jgi:hypothetical protein
LGCIRARNKVCFCFAEKIAIFSVVRRN